MQTHQQSTESQHSRDDSENLREDGEEWLLGADRDDLFKQARVASTIRLQRAK